MKKYLYQFGSSPANLGAALTSTLAYQAEDHAFPKLSNEEIKKLLAKKVELTVLDLVILEQQRRYYDASLVERTQAGFDNWIQRCLLRVPDKAARLEIADMNTRIVQSANQIQALNRAIRDKEIDLEAAREEIYRLRPLEEKIQQERSGFSRETETLRQTIQELESKLRRLEKV